MYPKRNELHFNIQKGAIELIPTAQQLLRFPAKEMYPLRQCDSMSVNGERSAQQRQSRLEMKPNKRYFEKQAQVPGLGSIKEST